jgi:hypothetical protein
VTRFSARAFHASVEVFHQHQITDERIDLGEQDVAAVGGEAEADLRVEFDVGNFFSGPSGKAEKLQGVSTQRKKKLKPAGRDYLSLATGV